MYLKPQRLVPIDGTRRLNLFCQGTGSPTVILDAGTGGSTLDWREVQGEIARFTSVCSYDRAGYGFSDGPTRPSDAHNAVDDLHRLVVRAGLRTPLILVGHSNGGIYAALYAKRFPRDVAGMVLVDPGFTGQQDFDRYGLGSRQAQELRERNAAYIAFARSCLAAAKSGELLKRNSANSSCLDNPPNADAHLHQTLNGQQAKPQYYEAILSEYENTFGTSEGGTVNDREAPYQAHQFGSMPLVVLTASRHRADVRDFTSEDQAKYFLYWKLGHDRLAALSSRGRSVLVSDSGHFIQRDQPTVVVTYVKEVVSEVRGEAQ